MTEAERGRGQSGSIGQRPGQHQQEAAQLLRARSSDSAAVITWRGRRPPAPPRGTTQGFPDSHPQPSRASTHRCRTTGSGPNALRLSSSHTRICRQFLCKQLTSFFPKLGTTACQPRLDGHVTLSIRLAAGAAGGCPGPSFLCGVTTYWANFTKMGPRGFIVSLHAAVKASNSWGQLLSKDSHKLGPCSRLGGRVEKGACSSALPGVS